MTTIPSHARQDNAVRGMLPCFAVFKSVKIVRVVVIESADSGSDHAAQELMRV